METVFAVEMSDQDLVDACLAGEREAFTCLMQRHLDKVRGVVYNIVLDLTDTDDLTQEAFLSAYQALGEFRGKSAFSSWLCGIAVNKACSYVRKQKRRRELLAEVSDPAVSYQHPAHETLKDEAYMELQQAIGQLPVDFRVVLVLNVIEGHPTKEVAQICKCSTAVVYWRLHRARKILRRLLESGESMQWNEQEMES